MKNRTLLARYLVSGAVGLAAFLVYLPALRNGFVSWDDRLYVYENPALRQAALPFFKWAFSQFYAANWHPLTWISHKVDYTLWGLNPFGHHLSSTILHAINASLVCFLAIRLMEVFERSRKPAGTRSVFSSEGAKLLTGAVTGLLFGIHPQHVESVAWIAERKDVLCALFSLLSMLSYLAYVRALREPLPQRLAAVFSHRNYVCSLGCFILALLSKPMAVTLPVVLLIVDWYPSGRIRSLKAFGYAFTEKIPFFVFSLFSTAITILAQSSGEAIVPLEKMTLVARFIVGAKALTAYLLQVPAPVHLLPFYPFPRDLSYLSFSSLAPIALVAGITAACLVAARTQKIWLAIWLYYVITLLPVIGIIKVGGQAMADRYTYLPSVGPYLLVGVLAAWCIQRAHRLGKESRIVTAAAVLLAVGAIVTLSYFTIQQIGVWNSDITLWSSVIDKEPGQVPLAYKNRGGAYSKMGRPDKAVEDYNTLIALGVQDDEVFADRGIEYLKLGRRDLAIIDFKTACQMGNNFGCDAPQFLAPTVVEGTRYRQ